MPFPYVALAPGPKPATGASFGDGLSNDMVYMHAVFVRGLNSIYSQALSPKIPAEVTAFANYSLTWAALLEHHHLGEGPLAVLSPRLRQAADSKPWGIAEKFLFPFLAKQFPDEMARNESEHEVFATGLVTFKAYMEGVVTGTQVFKGEEVREILATFADKVVKHLNDEVSSPFARSLETHADLGHQDPHASA